MSENLNNAQDALDAFNEQPIFETIEPEDSYTRRLRILHDIEDMAHERVERGEMTASEAEECIWDCINWLENTNEAKGCE